MAAHDQTPPFFKRGLPLSARVTIYLALSFSLLVADLRLHYLEQIRQGLAVLTYPLQIAAATPADAMLHASEYFSDLFSLQRENRHLKAQQLGMAGQLLVANQLRQENADLRGLLAMRERLKATGPACVFSEPPLRPRLAETLSAGLPVRLAELDALGAEAGSYEQLLEALAGQLAGCLEGL